MGGDGCGSARSAGRSAGLAAALIAGLIPGPAGAAPGDPAADRDPLRALVTQVAERRLAEAGHGGLVVGVVRDGRSLVVGLGSTGGAGGAPPDGRTVYQIASLTKPFTGTILAELIRTGRVHPADPLRRHLHSVARVPEFDGRPIRLVDLATHTAGLPNVPETPTFSWSRLEDPRNPYKPLTPAEVDRWLAGYELATAPGTRFSYSNVGMAVLGEALEQAAGASYGQLLRRVVTERFGLTDTTAELNADQRARKAVGHAGGLPVPDWEAPAMLPSFGLYSTADDLVRWLRVNLGDCPGGCTADAVQTLALAQSVQVEGTALSDPGALGGGAMALGWFVARAGDGTPILWHSGSTGGFNTYMALSRAHRWGVVALTNSDPDRVVADRTAIDLLRLFEAGW
ncbi:serine hydrolase [Azospirillum halopraeferens]|uniref:serine hydrolase n=1 Tax=Azospirillum halopraeferens TaxID=34010 RepID=UPI000423010E|nr:serine hydrolase [Azospirillum halopraeferens]